MIMKISYDTIIILGESKSKMSASMAPWTKNSFRYFVFLFICFKISLDPVRVENELNYTSTHDHVYGFSYIFVHLKWNHAITIIFAINAMCWQTEHTLRVVRLVNIFVNLLLLSCNWLDSQWLMKGYSTWDHRDMFCPANIWIDISCYICR